MVAFDTTQITLFVSLVLAVAVFGLATAGGVLAEALVRNRRH